MRIAPKTAPQNPASLKKLTHSEFIDDPIYQNNPPKIRNTIPKDNRFLEYNKFLLLLLIRFNLQKRMNYVSFKFCS